MIMDSYQNFEIVVVKTELSDYTELIIGNTTYH
jgi:hypothetical protein